MLNGRLMLLQILLVLFVVSAAFGQNVEVLKAELKGMEGRLDAKIDGVKDTLDAKIDGVKDTLDAKIDGAKNELNSTIEGTKDELSASINGVKSEVVTIKWIIGIAVVLFVAFLGFVGHLLNHYVKKVLPQMVQRESKDTGGIGKDQTGEGVDDKDKIPEDTNSGYGVLEGSQ